MSSHDTSPRDASFCETGAISARADSGLAAGGPAFGPELRDVLKAVEQSVAQVNAVMQRAMAAGITIELHRGRRVHSGDGRWADQMVPLVSAGRQA